MILITSSHRWFWTCLNPGCDHPSLKWLWGGTRLLCNCYTMICFYCQLGTWIANLLQAFVQNPQTIAQQSSNIAQQSWSISKQSYNVLWLLIKQFFGTRYFDKFCLLYRPPFSDCNFQNLPRLPQISQDICKQLITGISREKPKLMTLIWWTTTRWQHHTYIHLLG